MATASEDKPKIAELKDHVYGMTDVGKQADQYNKTTRQSDITLGESMVMK